LTAERVFAVGDVHADWEKFNLFLERKKPDTVIACGDFGFWPGFKRIVATGQENGPRYTDIWKEGLIKNGNCPIFFCDGNHENHWKLIELVEKHGREHPIEVLPGVFYCPRGCIIEINGKKILLFGGAFSVDRHLRRMGVDWFPEEIPSYSELEFALENIKKHGGIDIVVSHTAPRVLDVPGVIKELDKYDSARDMLDVILKETNPELWFYGHFHRAHEATVGNTRFIGLTTTNRFPEDENFYKKLTL